MTEEQRPNATLKELRDRLDELDSRIVQAVGDRLAICAEIGRIKRTAGIPMMQRDRVAYVRDSFGRQGTRVGLAPEFTMALVSLIVEEACRVESQIMNDSQGSDRDPGLEASLFPTPGATRLPPLSS
jgi:chorismate mutase-like protein